MIADWWSYEASDFLLFSPRTYWRLFELQNQALWPAQVASLGFGILIPLGLLRHRPWPARLSLLVLAALWIWVAWSFFLQRYATINWAAPYIAPVFMAEAALLVCLAFFRGGLSFEVPRRRTTNLIGTALYLYALALHPFIGLISGRPLEGAEIFGLAPDPTAIATLGLLMLTPPRRWAWLLFLPPLLWCAASAATLLAMQAWEGWIPLAAIVLTLVARAWRLIPEERQRASS